MSVEHSNHISKSEALFATAAGLLLGTGIFLPGLAGLGLTVGAIGVIRFNSRERDREFKELADYLRPLSKKQSGAAGHRRS